jgi:hypothetical protein
MTQPSCIDFVLIDLTGITTQVKAHAAKNSQKLCDSGYLLKNCSTTM